MNMLQQAQRVLLPYNGTQEHSCPGSTRQQGKEDKINFIRR